MNIFILILIAPFVSIFLVAYMYRNAGTTWIKENISGIFSIWMLMILFIIGIGLLIGELL